MGHSLGGGISLQLAHDAPNRIDKLVLIAPAAYWWFPRPVQLASRIPVLPHELLRLALNSRRAHSAVWSAAVGDSTTPDTIQIATRERHLRVKGTLDTLVAMAGSPRDSDLPAGIKDISAPTLILWGEEDMVLPATHGKRLVRDLPNARLKIIPHVGHIPSEQAPEQVNRIILDFLQEGY